MNLDNCKLSKNLIQWKILTTEKKSAKTWNLSTLFKGGVQVGVAPTCNKGRMRDQWIAVIIETSNHRRPEPNLNDTSSRLEFEICIIFNISELNYWLHSSIPWTRQSRKSCRGIFISRKNSFRMTIVAL